MVFVGRRIQGGHHTGVEAAGVGGEDAVVAEVLHGLVGVVAQEGVDVLGPAEVVVDGAGVVDLVVIQFEEEVEGEVAVQFVALALGGCLLELVADVVAVDGLVADDEADDVGGVGDLAHRREPQGEVEAGVEQERFQHDGGDLAGVRVQVPVAVEDEAALALQVLVLAGPAEGGVDLGGVGQRHKDVGVGLRVD